MYFLQLHNFFSISGVAITTPQFYRMSRDSQSMRFQVRFETTKVAICNNWCGGGGSNGTRSAFVCFGSFFACSFMLLTLQANSICKWLQYIFVMRNYNCDRMQCGAENVCSCSYMTHSLVFPLIILLWFGSKAVFQFHPHVLFLLIAFVWLRLLVVILYILMSAPSRKHSWMDTFVEKVEIKFESVFHRHEEMYIEVGLLMSNLLFIETFSWFLINMFSRDKLLTYSGSVYNEVSKWKSLGSGRKHAPRWRWTRFAASQRWSGLHLTRLNLNFAESRLKRAKGMFFHPFLERINVKFRTKVFQVNNTIYTISAIFFCILRMLWNLLLVEIGRITLLAISRFKVYNWRRFSVFMGQFFCW